MSILISSKCLKKKKLIDEMVNKVSIEKNEIKTKLLNILTLLFLILLFDANFFTIEKLNPNKRIGNKPLIIQVITIYFPYSWMPILYVIIGMIKKLTDLTIDSETNLNLVSLGNLLK